MLALLRTRRWVGFTALVVVAIVGFGLLSRWQWQRAEEKRVEKAALAQAAAATPLDLATATAADIDGLAEWEPVTVTGTYGDQQVVVRQRPQNGANGYWLLAPMEVAGTDGSARTVWVSRGWVPAGASATTTPEMPAPPAGTVTVRGGWHAFEPYDPDRSAGLPAGMVADVSPQALPVPSSVDGFVQASASQPADDAVAPVPAPTIDEGRNLSYAGQWLIFAVVAIIGWFIFLRREAKDTAAERAASTDAPTPAP